MFLCRNVPCLVLVVFVVMGVVITPAAHAGQCASRSVAVPSPQSGVISSIAGKGSSWRGFSGDGGLAIKAGLNLPFGVAVTADGGTLIADSGNHRVRLVARDGTITTIAGSGPTAYGKSGFGGDGGPATEARLHSPDGVAVTADGGILIADTTNHCVRLVARAAASVTLNSWEG